jgi:hypothetical protein
MIPPPEAAGSEASAYSPFTNTRRPGGKPDYEPQFRVLVHQKHAPRWEQLVERIGLEQAQRFYDHVAQHPGAPAAGIRMNILKGRAGSPEEQGLSNCPLAGPGQRRAARLSVPPSLRRRQGRR